MLCSIIAEALSGRCEVTVIGHSGREAVADAEGADVVLTTATDPDNPAGPMTLLWRRPTIRVVVIASSGQRAVLYELCPRRRAFGDLSPASLVEAICHETLADV